MNPGALTEEQIAELATALSELYADLGALGAFFKIRTKGAEILPFGRDRWHEEQRRFDESRTGRDVVLKPRQIGFSTLELARDLQYALTHPGAQVLVVVHDRKLGELLFAGLKLMHEGLVEAGIAPTAIRSNVRELVFGGLNSSVRVVESGATDRTASGKGRSGTVHRLHATEVAFWPAAWTTMRALLGCVPDDGEVVIESTPNGAAGMFFATFNEAWAGRGPYRAHFFAWYEHAAYRAKAIPPGFDPTPRDRWEVKLRAAGVDDHQIAWWRARVDDPQFGLSSALQEFPIDAASAFRTSGGQWLPGEALDDLGEGVRPPVALLTVRGAQLRIYRGQRPAQLGGGWDTKDGFIIGADVAEGIEGDRSTMTVIDAKTAEVVAAWHSDAIEPGDFGHAIADVARVFSTPRDPALVAIMRQNHGHAAIRALTHEAHHPEHRIWRDEDGRLGLVENSKSRPVLWDELGKGIREGAFKTPDADTVAECKSLIRDVDGHPRAAGKGTKGGAHDDLFVGWAAACYARARPGFNPKGFRIPGL